MTDPLRCFWTAQSCEPEKWTDLFEQARELGISFILLAGGEPMVRRGVIGAAGRIPQILFPIFTNGTMLDEDYLKLFETYRNLIPVFSIEGDQAKTDQRRGTGVYEKLMEGMGSMQKRQLLFGCSVTVTKENLSSVISSEFVESLKKRGCKAVFFIEFVPVTEEGKSLAPGEAERELFQKGLKQLREEYDDMLFVSFPGDEKSSGGCVAAGRGFFHINSHGGAEPCPFSPYSDQNVRDTSLKEAINSKLFLALQNGDFLTGEHEGGCVLFEKRAQVEALL